jgi:hypothetical protein
MIKHYIILKFIKLKTFLLLSPKYCLPFSQHEQPITQNDCEPQPPVESFQDELVKGQELNHNNRNLSYSCGILHFCKAFSHIIRCLALPLIMRSISGAVIISVL